MDIQEIPEAIIRRRKTLPKTWREENFRKAKQYIAMCLSKEEQLVSPLRRVLPTRQAKEESNLVSQPTQRKRTTGNSQMLR